jgi:hypothetical protein
MMFFLLSEKFSDADLLSKKWYSLLGRLSIRARTSLTKMRVFRSLPASPRDRATNGITCVSGGDVGADEAAEMRDSPYRMCLLLAVQGSCECCDVAVRFTDQNPTYGCQENGRKGLFPSFRQTQALGLTRGRDAMRRGHLTQGNKPSAALA